MRHRVGVVAAVLLAFALSGAAACPAVADADTRPRAVLAAHSDSDEDGADAGNNRPAVSYDGLMVRRRVVLGVHPTPGADFVRLRDALEVAATRNGLSLADISPNVLGPLVLEHLVPKMTVVLQASATLADAERMIDPTTYPGGSIPGVDHIHVESVLVHDLRFTVSSGDPAALTLAIAREGILSDALGNYQTSPGKGELEITYTGPLLSDELVASVRVGVARGALAAPDAVTVSARSDTGVGVDMATEPGEALPTEDSDHAEDSDQAEEADHAGDASHTEETSAHAKELPVALSSEAQPASPSFWGVTGVGVTALLLLAAAALVRVRRDRDEPEKIPVRIDERRPGDPPHP